MILEIKDISKSFGRIQALSSVDIGIEEGEILGVAGPNGAGKTTLFNVIAGVYRPSGGRLIFQGRDVTNKKSYRICHLGLARTFQVPKTFPTLSVYDNVRVGATFGNKRVSESRIKERIDSALELLGLSGVRDTEAVHLDLYTTKLAGLAMSLATDPKLLMLDEPLAGLALDEIEKFLKVVRRLNAEKRVTIIMIEHILDSLCEVSDRLVILNFGEVICSGDPQEAMCDPQVIECYLGRGKEPV
jgi:branched-chain amino acid transport system ATP-binding protein